MPTFYCPECGYNLTGLTEHRCPECGKAFDPEILKCQAEAEIRNSVTIAKVVGTPIISSFCCIVLALTIAQIDLEYPYNPLTAYPLFWIELLVLTAITPILFGIHLGKRYRKKRLRNHPDRGHLPTWMFVFLHIAIQYIMMWMYVALLILLLTLVI